MNYKSIVVTKRGGPEVLEIQENELLPPAVNEARIKILATPVCQDDVAVRVGNRPFLAKPPFIPGYSTLGIVEAIGSDVTEVAVGDRVAALTQFGSYSEYITLPEEILVKVPASLDPAKAAVLILNYLVAYQVMHRVVNVNPGDRVLIIGASGGVGTAFMQLGQLAQLKMYGLASLSKHNLLIESGTIPIDYHSQDMVEQIRKLEPEGLDYVFNGMGEEYFERSLAVLRRGGALVHYGGPQSFSRFILLVIKLLWYNLLPNGKKIMGYGTHRGDRDQDKGDWRLLFRLLEEGKLDPVIAARFPILEAASANELLESGQTAGNIVLLAPELM